MRIYKRGSSPHWWIELSHNGRQIRKSTGTTDRRAAQEFADRLKADRWRQRQLGGAPAVAWDEAALAWLTERTHLRALGDRKDHLRWLTRHLTGQPCRR